MDILIPIIVIFISTISSSDGQANFANNLEGCTKSQPIDLCLRATLEELRSLMPIGIPELGLNATEPLQIANLNFTQGSGPVAIDTIFTNVVVRGLSKFNTEDIRADTRTRRLFMRLSVPEINIRGNYIIDGKIFVLPIQGRGPFFTQLGGVVGTGGAEIVTIGPTNDQKLSIRNTHIDFDIARIQIRMDNLFGGTEEVFSDTVNKFLNDHGDLVLEEIKPKIQQEMVKLVERVLNNAFSKLSVNQLLQNIHQREVGRSTRSGRTRIFNNN